MSANRLALDLGVPSGRTTDILKGRRSIAAGTVLRLGRYFGDGPHFSLELPSRHDLAVVAGARVATIARRVQSAGA